MLFMRVGGVFWKQFCNSIVFISKQSIDDRSVMMSGVLPGGGTYEVDVGV